MVMHYMGPRGLCTILNVDYQNRTLTIENHTNQMIYRAFGIIENPTWEDYQRFLRDRCVPETRHHLDWYLKAVGVDAYDPLTIIRKTQGRMAEDHQWIEIIEE